MFDKLRQSRLLFWTLELLALATLIYVATKINFIFIPIGAFFSTLFMPILLAGFLYYMLNPIVELLEKHLKIKRIYGILLVFLILIGLIVFIIVAFIPNLINQLTGLARQVPNVLHDTQEWVLGLSRYRIFQNIDIQSYAERLNVSWGDVLSTTLNNAAASIGSIVNVIGQIAFFIVTVPFILFYMLKDGERIIPMVEKVFPKRSEKTVIHLLSEMNKTIQTYISGQLIECLFVFVMMFIGYLILGIRYAFLFAVIAGLCNLIPYIGPYLGLAPSFVATIFVSPVRAMLIILLVLIVQQLDSNLVYPNVIGKSLNIHPLTIIFIILVGGNLAGLLGIFLGVPFYAILKNLLIFFKRWYETRQEEILRD